MLYNVLQEVNILLKLKLRYRWLSPFCISKAILKNRTFLLEEINKTKLKGIFVDSKLKVF